MKRKYTQLTAYALALVLIAAAAAGCLTDTAESYNYEFFTTYRDIPGITEAEIAAIEALQAQGDTLIYASSRSTELFERLDGTLGGYTVLFCRWLSELFGIEFQPEIQGLGAMLENLGSGAIQFATLSDTPDRREIYFMTNPIAQRSIKAILLDNSPSIAEISRERLPRYVFTEGSVTLNLIAETLAPGTYETIIVPDEDSAYHALKDDIADAFIANTIMEAAFDQYGDVHTEDFLPLIFLPAAMAAEDPQFEPVISIVTKALENGAYEYLTELYKQGYQEYRKHKFSLLLTEEETEYLRSNETIPFVSQYMSYPVSYYNTNNGKWEGIVFDIIDELQELTGLKFELINDQTAELAELLALLESGEAYVMPNLLQSDERMNRFIWTDTIYQLDKFALISKRSYPNIDLNDIPYEKIGFAANSAFADMFRTWFPNALYAKEYPNNDEAFAALERGEINLVMTAQSRLAALTNYYELSDFKANYLFNTDFKGTFGFNKDQTVLCSIINKALIIIDTERIVEEWKGVTHNLEAMRLRQQRPWLVGAIMLSLIALAMLFFILVNNNRKRKSISELLEREKKISQSEQHQSKKLSEALENLRETSAQLEKAMGEAERSSRYKSDFMAKMSHEIRTPMNAIIGMSELALRENSASVKDEHIHMVRQAGYNLLAIVNDILDFSKIEAGKMDIVPKEYVLASLLNDVIDIIKMRASDSHLHFAVKVDSKIPRKLYGDETKIRQAVLNVSNNAVKFTEKGSVTLGVYGEVADSDTLNLIFEVSDTGIGIKPEDTERIFGDFSRVESEKIRNIEGTGLGLAIAHSIVEAMGGSIKVESVYGKGSKFTITVPQEIRSRNTLAEVTHPEEKHVLVYERRIAYADSIIYTLNNLGVEHTLVKKISELSKSMESRAYDYLFIPFSLWTHDKDTLQKYGKDTKIIILTELGKMVPDVRHSMLTMPAYCIHIADILGGGSGGKSYARNTEPNISFTAPEAKVLVVDDMATNLKVAKGFLKPYNMQVDICKSGEDALKAMQNAGSGDGRYDLVLMDHLMPGMDGMETTIRIREMGELDPYYKDIPILALTANAVSGTKEMLIDNGFSDFLSKPVNTIDFNAALEKWIPEEKQIKYNSK